LPIFLSHGSQSAVVTGEISLTCDAWQASNCDGYFAVTGHWIQAPSPMQWELQSALFGFTQINNAHNGLRLGQALFKVAQRISITEKVMLPSRLGAPLPSHV
jgi:hypothetical protein